MSFDAIYIIRDAGFGRDFTPKVLTALVAIGLVLWDVRRQRRLDYMWVFTTGTVIWAAAEAFLSFQGIRDMPVRTLVDRPLSLPASYLIQGMSEGAFVAVVGLFVGDRVLNRVSRARGYLIGVIALVALAAVTFRSRRFLLPGEPASRRDILDPKALACLLVLSAIAIVFAIAWRQWRPRTLAMFAYMLVFGIVWASTQVLIGGRWVEVDATGGGYERAGPLVTVFALGFDVVVEIALIYISFLAIPVIIRLMRDPTPLPHPRSAKRSEQEPAASV